MNKNRTFKHVLLFAFFLLSGAFYANANITIDNIFITGETDNMDGTCTYDVAILVSNTTTAVTANLSVNAGSIACTSGACTGVAVSPGSTIIASITKGCADVIKLTIEGFDGAGISCGSASPEFSGLEPLPAELIAFEAVKESRHNTLLWKTASEENTLFFQIERSLDGRTDFEAIGRVTASINSTTLRSYEFTDENPLSLAYYRLQIFDRDGAFEFSDVIAVERAKTDISVIEVYPVPAINNEVTVLVHSKKDGPVFLDLFDMTGRVIKQDRVELKEGVNRLALDWESKEGNVYFFTIYNGSERISQKIVKSNIN